MIEPNKLHVRPIRMQPSFPVQHGVFIVFFMMVNHVRNTDQVKRFIICLFLTCFIASIIGAFQIPGGGRVSAPFEGDVGEPNTFGGYLLFMGILAAGLLAKTDNFKIKQILTVFLLCIIPPFR